MIKPISQIRKQGPERLGKSLKVTQLVNHGARICRAISAHPSGTHLSHRWFLRDMAAPGFIQENCPGSSLTRRVCLEAAFAGHSTTALMILMEIVGWEQEKGVNLGKSDALPDQELL